MADSNATKKALACALKELMSKNAFEKISITDICTECNMSRKSFYYHFKDKYDLVNWIFDSEFLGVAADRAYNSSWEAMRDVCQYFYDNRTFYRKALKIAGQNSFSEHFRELLLTTFESRFSDILALDSLHPFQANFFADAFVMSFRRWILEYTTMTPDEFLLQLEKCIQCLIDSYANTH